MAAHIVVQQALGGTDFRCRRELPSESHHFPSHLLRLDFLTHPQQFWARGSPNPSRKDGKEEA